MVIVGNWRTAVIGSIVSLVIFAIVYFTVIKPDNNTANQAAKAGLQLTQQALKQSQTAQNQVNQAVKQATAGAPAAAASQAQAAGAAVSKSLSKAQQLAACVQTAGTNVSAISTCQAKYQG
jgi:hypothetical protein